MNHPKYLLRWCFEYANKPKKYGLWSNPGEHQTEQAWCQNKEGLLEAVIEGKNFITREIIPLASINGQDFVNFQWIASATQRGLKVSGRPLPKSIVGLMIVGREDKIKIYNNGLCQTEKHNLDYGRINLAGFGR